MYYLGTDNCAYKEDATKIICGVSDFEVTVDKIIYAISDGSTNASNSDNCIPASDPTFKYCLYDNKRGLTLVKDTPIFIDMDNKTSEAYNS